MKRNPSFKQFPQDEHVRSTLRLGLAIWMLLAPPSVFAQSPQSGPSSSVWLDRGDAAGLLVIASARDGAKPLAPACHFNNRTYASGSTIRCSMDPNKNRGCAMGLPFAEWSCKAGRWVLSGSHR